MTFFEYIEGKYELDVEQQLVLAALTHPAPAQPSFYKKWLSTIDFDSIEYGTLRLVPLLFSTFQDHEQENPYYGKMKGIYRYFSFKNTLLLSKAWIILNALHDANIDFILFKGIALTLHYYKNNAIRPMGDIDFLVHPRDVLHAEKILLKHGLRYRYETNRRILFNEHSLDYIDEQEQGFDLHHYALLESMTPDIDEGIWNRARTLTWDGLAIKIMAPEDLIFTSCINGIRDFTTKRYDWIYDVITLIQKEPHLCWDTLYQEATNRHLNEPLFDALSLVHSVSQKSVDFTQLNECLSHHPEDYNKRLSILVSEGRTHGINPVEVSRLLKHQASLWRIFKRKKILNASKHIRYFYDENEHINRLYLHRDCVSEMRHVFDLIHPRTFKATFKYSGYINIRPGELLLKSDVNLSCYSAQIKLYKKNDLVFNPGEKKEIKIKLKNTGSIMWIDARHPEKKYGVSYHLFNMDGALLSWDNPRHHFLASRKNYVAFFGKKERTMTMEIHAPKQPGEYIIQFDIVHEQVLWYSEKGNKFPQICIKVKAKNGLN
jgi:hypothetical protein